ncbi:MAG: PAS domain S-box protein, partial [Hydrogenophaga sp.]|nr:PAS domain S-box protein [Hydrogenophaga sp.]
MRVESPPSFNSTAPGSRLSVWLTAERPAWLRYGVAIGVTLLAVWVRMLVAPAESGGRFVTPALAVALSALYGGWGPGLLSTLLGMVLVNFFLVGDPGSFAFDNLSEAFWLNTWHLLTQLVVLGAIAVMQSRNRQLQEATRRVRESRQRFLDTFEHAASGITHVGIDGRLLEVNETFCHMVGYSRQELERMTFQDITVPDDLSDDLRQLEETLAGQHTSYSLIKRYRHKDGHIVWAQLTVALMRAPDGQPDYFISVIQDISAQKSAEEDLRTNRNLLDQAQRLAHLNAWQAEVSTGQIRSVPGTRAISAFTRPEYTFDELVQLIHPDDRSRFLEHVKLAIRNQIPCQIEYRVPLKGKEHWFALKAEFERDDQGRALRALGVTQDITERKETELEIQRLNATLEQRILERTRALQDAYDELESYSYAVAHDLRSPLRIINGFAQALREDNPGLGTESQDHLGRIMAASKKMGELIDGLLSLAQFSRGELSREPVNLSAIAQQILEDLSAAEPARQVDWSVEPELFALADPPLVEALMQNLLHNAWKYTASA